MRILDADTPLVPRGARQPHEEFAQWEYHLCYSAKQRFAAKHE